jgi:hypothetical protein
VSIEAASLLVVGAREADPARRPIPESEARPCSSCGEATMFSRATLIRAAEHAEERFVCIPCAVAGDVLSGVVLLPPDGAQSRELESAGYGPDDFALRSEWGTKLQRRKGGGQ